MDGNKREEKNYEINKKEKLKSNPNQMKKNRMGFKTKFFESK